MGEFSLSEHRLILAVTTSPELLLPGTPGIVVKDEQELEKIASELGKMFFADVHRLSNGVVLIKNAAR